MKKSIVISLVAILFIVAWQFPGDEPNVTQAEIASHLSVINAQSSSLVNAISNSSVSSIQQISESNQIKLFESMAISSVNSGYRRAQRAAEYKAWRHSRGIFDEEELVEYEGFKLDQLEELANRGDLKAIDVLMKYELSNRNSKRFNELIELGAVYGSLKSLRLTGAKKMADHILSKKESDLLEVFAYKEFQGRRGDLSVKSKIPVDYKLYNFYPNSEQAAYIDRRADELMEELEKKREILGLPPLDNSTTQWDREKFGE